MDLILKKSISRFGRNTVNMLRSLRDLHGLGVEVYFEQEDMSRTMKCPLSSRQNREKERQEWQ
ncbi:hypothetical protein [Oscillibacter sp. 1-3]|uniref:hypothetical protein n=1 Tax=Oscillibacter sp. 1-3 TaxID=1235797 RepID=UPI00210F4C9A|nr:hypothetical protein [Oscillibacter sp. 1-3]